MKRIFDSFATKEGRSRNQKSQGATEKRLDSGKWMKEETNKRKKASRIKKPGAYTLQQHYVLVRVHALIFLF